MTEILTESFCERCGTRYTFEPVPPRSKPLATIGAIGRGLRHFVSDPGSSLDEAFAVARSESEQRTTATALEAFHRTFNFCLSCRRYTCADCWNAVEGRCLSCAPVPEAAPPTTRADTAVRLPPLGASSASAPIYMELPEVDAAAEAEAQAQALADAALVAETEARAAAQAAAADAEAAEAAEVAQAEAAEVAQAAAEAHAEDEARTIARAEAEAEARATAEAEAQAAAAAAEAQARADAEAAATLEAQARADAETRAAAELAAEAEARAAAEAAAPETGAAGAAATGLAFEPGLNLDEQIAAYERAIAAVPPATPAVSDAVEAAVEPVAIAPEPEVTPIAAEPEPVAAEPEVTPIAAEPEPVAAEPAAVTPEPIPTAIGRPIPAIPTDGQLQWPEPEAAAAVYEAQWPNLPTSRRAASRARTAVPPIDPGAVADDAQWPSLPPITTRSQMRVGAGLPGAASAPPPAPARACPSCGLSLSASARFCRRCGTPQQVDAAR